MTARGLRTEYLMLRILTALILGSAYIAGAAFVVLLCLPLTSRVQFGCCICISVALASLIAWPSADAGRIEAKEKLENIQRITGGRP